jgi:tetratricopeptide (TPR) repeat protein
MDKIWGATNNILNDESFVLPKVSTADILEKKIMKIDTLALKMQFEILGSNLEDYYLDEKEMNALGDDLININENKKAIEIFLFTQSVFPDSWLVYNKLGKSYRLIGDIKNALMNFNKSLELNPLNNDAKEEIKNLLSNSNN